MSIFGGMARTSKRNTREFNILLNSANIQIKPEVYIATVYMNTLIMSIVSLVVAFVLFFISMTFNQSFIDLFARGDIVGGIVNLIILILIVVLVPYLTFTLGFAVPKLKKNARKRNMEANLPYAANFVSAMASANATPIMIFKALALQKDIYGEVAVDAMRIYKDVSLLGMDIITALKMAIERAPSPKYRDFIQGITSTLQSGGNLKSYFLNKAREYMREHESEQKEFLETLSFMAESYVVVAVAMPIFLMVILVIMYWISGKGANIGETLLFLVIFVMLPTIHVGYIIGVNIMTPEV